MPGLAEATRESAGQFNGDIAQPGTRLPLIDPSQKPLFIENWNKRPFLFHHNLCEIEQFQPRYIRQIAQRLVDAETPIYVNSGKGKVDAGFDAPDEGGKQFSAAEALAQMQDEELLFKLPKISKMPEYQQFQGEPFSDILEMSGLPRKGWDEWRSISVFMAGPRRITPYHIDAEMGYLCQVTGTKKVWIADGGDRDILSETELEQFWRGQGQSAKFSETAKQRAWEFTLTPGMGVHLPINFPHWVENGDEVSISVSLGFHAIKWRPGAVHRFNSYLRQMHMKPTPPGKLAWLDATKEGIYETAKAAGRMMKSAKT